MLARNTLLAVCLYIFSYGGPPIFVTMIVFIERCFESKMSSRRRRIVTLMSTNVRRADRTTS